MKKRKATTDNKTNRQTETHRETPTIEFFFFSFGVFVCLRSLYLSVCVSVSLCLCVSVSLCLCVSVSLCLSLSRGLAGSRRSRSQQCADMLLSASCCTQAIEQRADVLHFEPSWYFFDEFFPSADDPVALESPPLSPSGLPSHRDPPPSPPPLSVSLCLFVSVCLPLSHCSA